VRRNIAAGICEHLRVEDVPLLSKREALAADWIVNELGHGHSSVSGSLV
jgi:hypothetical protein